MSHTPTDNRRGNYEIGYKKPPKHTRFQKGGRPPNPKGRPRKQFNLAELIRKELDRQVTVRENGRTIRMTIREAWMRRIINEATKGKRRAQRTFVKVAKPAEAWLGDPRPNIFWLIDSEYKDKPKS
jgi:Family of unknown function (DUF5681)